MPDTAFKHISNEISYELPTDIPERYISEGKAIFTAYGCVLVERQTEKSYCYNAVNLSSGKAANICRRIKPITESAHPAMAAKIRELPIAGSGRYETDKTAGTSHSLVNLKKYLQYIFTKILPRHGYIVRDNQVALAEYILETISRRAISLAEAEVGIGKTLALHKNLWWEQLLDYCLAYEWRKTQRGVQYLLSPQYSFGFTPVIFCF